MSPTIANEQVARPPRIVFIDVVRAYAILMMLQGHFVDTLLANVYRDLEHPIYSLWWFMRGMTAPIFFFSTGLVFIYLLLKDSRPPRENVRLRKGLRRGLFLIGLGYLLKINLPGLLLGYYSSTVLAVEVLHCIGLALVVLVGLAFSAHQLRAPLWPLLLVAGLFFFLIDPSFTTHDFSAWPVAIANYMTRDFGSVFTPVPWIGYSMFGGLLGYAIHLRPRLAFTHWFPLALVGLAILLIKRSYPSLMALYEFTGWENFTLIAHNNYLFWRLGHALIVVSIFMWVLHFLPRVPKLLTKIGSETLTIYCGHYVLLYGTWLGVGLSTFYGRALTPWPAVIGALLFVLLFVVLIAYIEPIRAWLYVKLPRWAFYQLRRSRVLIWRFMSQKSRRRIRLYPILRLLF